MTEIRFRKVPFNLDNIHKKLGLTRKIERIVKQGNEVIVIFEGNNPVPKGMIQAVQNLLEKEYQWSLERIPNTEGKEKIRKIVLMEDLKKEKH